MLNKIIVMILSVGILSHSSTEVTQVDTEELAADLATGLSTGARVSVGIQQAVYDKFNCVLKSASIKADRGHDCIDYDSWRNDSTIKTITQGCMFLTAEGTLDIGESLPAGAKKLHTASSNDNYISKYSSGVCIVSAGSKHLYCGGDWCSSNYPYDSNPTAMLVSYRYYPSAVVRVYEKTNSVGDITADKGGYPVDGRHSDGYWYVLRNLVEE